MLSNWEKNYDENLARCPDYDDDEPEEGSCWNCGHCVCAYIRGKSYGICVRGHDEDGDGDADEAPDVRDCDGWVAS